MTGRKLRQKGKVDYKKLNSQGKEKDLSEEDMELYTDLDGEKELCGSFNQEEELDFNEYVTQENSDNSDIEEGEVTSESESEESSEEDEIEACRKIEIWKN